MTYRVVQWGTGAVGSMSLRQIIDTPDLELVGVWVSSDAKHGKDAGDLCDREKTGVLATSSKDEILALEADVVIHNAIAVSPGGEALPFDEDVLVLLASGKNVISSVSYFSPMIEGPECMARIQAACEAGSSTLYGGGIDPGFVCDRLPAILSGSVGQIEHILMIESQDVTHHPSFALLSQVGFGKTPDKLDQTGAGFQYYAGRLLCAAVPKLAALMGVEIDAIVPRHELVFAPEPMTVAMGPIEQGAIIGMLAEFTGMRRGVPVITHQWVTFMGREHVPDHWLTFEPEPGQAPPYYVRIEIKGRPALKVDLTYTDEEDITSFSAPTAAVCVNAIPGVVSAVPGLLLEPVFGIGRIAETPAAVQVPETAI